MKAQIHLLTTLGLGLLTVQISADGFRTAHRNERECQGQAFAIECGIHFGQQSVMQLKSVTVLTNHNSKKILEESNYSEDGCTDVAECRRTIHDYTDTGISKDYRHLYQYIASLCQGKSYCEGDLPEWWALIDDTRATCGSGVQYFAGVIIDVECWVDSRITTVAPPPSTTPKTKPTTPTTTTSFPVFVPIYQPDLVGREKVILGVAIGLSLAILLVLLIVLYCCERYRHHKRLGKILRMLGAPQAQDDAFDELDYGRKDGWDSDAQNLDALGEYTGVKPDEFVTLDKKAMESSGQIMYDTPTDTTHKGNNCATIDKRNHRRSSPSSPILMNNHEGHTDYNTEENLDLEQRMAATLNHEAKRKELIESQI